MEIKIALEDTGICYIVTDNKEIKIDAEIIDLRRDISHWSETCKYSRGIYNNPKYRHIPFRYTEEGQLEEP